MAQGRVVVWTDSTAKGRVAVGGQDYDFFSTSFHSIPRRFPVIGEPVDVVFQAGQDRILMVVAAEESVSDHVREFHERSGAVTSSDPLVGFLYLLMRDYVTPGTLEGILAKCPPGEDTKFTNGWLASYAQDVASRLKT